MPKPEDSLTGVWHGLYSYPRYLSPVFFMATLIAPGRAISGSTQEAITGKSGTPLTLHALLSGDREGQQIAFRKVYQQSPRDKNPIDYSGTLNEDASEIEGIWTIPGNWSGRFLMIRKTGMTEHVIRQVFETVR